MLRSDSDIAPRLMVLYLYFLGAPTACGHLSLRTYVTLKFYVFIRHVTYHNLINKFSKFFLFYTFIHFCLELSIISYCFLSLNDTSTYTYSTYIVLLYIISLVTKLKRLSRKDVLISVVGWIFRLKYFSYKLFSSFIASETNIS